MEPAEYKLLEERIVALQKLFEQRLDLEEKARQLQATEYERRLRELNGEHARLAQERGTYLPREVYQTYIEDRRKWENEINATIAAAAGQKHGTDKTWTTVIAALTAIVSAVVTYISTRWHL